LLLIKRDFTLSTFQQELVVSLTVAGAFFGSLGELPRAIHIPHSSSVPLMAVIAGGGAMSTSFGRKPSIMVGSVVFIAGAAVLAFAPSWIVLAAGNCLQHLAQVVP
jgi:SP family myo-inositol transporter-like MFS transporter 13